MAHAVLVALLLVGFSIIIYWLWFKLTLILDKISIDWIGLLKGQAIEGHLRLDNCRISLNGLRWHFDRHRVKIILEIQKIDAEINPQRPVMTNSSIIAEKEINLGILNWPGKFVTLRVHEAHVGFEYRSPSFNNYSHLLPKLKLSVIQLRLFDEDGEGRILPVQCETVELMADEVEYVVLSSISLRHMVSSHGDSLDLSVASMKMTIEASWMLVVTTFAADHGKSKTESRTKLHRMVDVNLRIKQVVVEAVFPITDTSLQRFSGALLQINSLSFQTILLAQQIHMPIIVLTASEASLLAVSSKELSHRSYTKLDGLLGRAGESGNDTIMHGRQLVVTNGLEPGFTLEEGLLPVQLNQLIKSIADGRPCFSVGEEVPKVPPCTHSRLSFERWSTFGYSEISRLVQEPFHFIGSASTFSFSLPFEFPLSIYFDHLIFLSKVIQSPIKPHITPQSFSPFEHTWRLTLLLDRAVFSLADDPFEIAIQRIHVAKQAKAPVFLELEDYLWRHPPTELPCGSRPPPSTAFLHATADPKYAETHPTMAAKLVEMYDLFLRDYKKRCTQLSIKEMEPLFAIKGERVTFSVRWDFREDVRGDDILNGMEEGSKYFDGDMLKRLNTLLGGYCELLAARLQVSVRDYAMPMIDTSRVAIIGPLVLVEGEPTSEVTINKRVHIVNGSFDIEIPTCILPISIHHCLNLLHDDKEGLFRVAFSPRWDGAFLTLERGFDLFSHPSEERSPPLAVWDKLRLLFRGTWTRVAIKSPCLVYCLTTLMNSNDYALLELKNGFDLGLDGAASMLFILNHGRVVVSSEQLSLLLARLQAEGKSYFGWDCKSKGLGGANDIPILHVPETRMGLSFSYWNHEGDPIPLDFKPKLVARQHDPTGMDSYKVFRIHSTSLHFQLETRGPQDKIDQEGSWWISYYREIELWIERQFMCLTLPCVRRGPLFASPFISSSRGQKIWKVLTELHLSVDFAVALAVRLLYFHDASLYSGILLTAVGGRCWLDWRKGMIRSSLEGATGHRLQWQHYFGQVDLAEARLSFLTNRPEEMATDEWDTLCIRSVPAAFCQVPDEACHQFLLGPRLFYLAIDELCFQDDPQSQAVQRASIEGHLEVLERGTEELLSKLRSIDPDTDMTKFQRLKAEIGVEHDQRDYLHRYLEASSNAQHWKDRASRHHVIIHSAQLQWHPRLRDAVWIFVDQQVQQYRQAYSLTYRALRMVRQACKRSKLIASSSPPSASSADRSRRPTLSPAQLDSPQNFVQSLLDNSADIPQPEHTTWIAEREAEVGEEEKGGKDFRSPQELAQECNLWMPQCLTVQFYTPQLSLLGRTGEGSPAAITLVARHATVDTAPLWTSSQGGQVMGRRTKVVLGQAELFASRKEELEAHHGIGKEIL